MKRGTGGLERAWRAWLVLEDEGREKFRQRFRIHHAEAMAARREANGTASAYRGTSSLAGLSLDGVPLAGLADELGPTSLEELTLDW